MEKQNLSSHGFCCLMYRTLESFCFLQKFWHNSSFIYIGNHLAFLLTFSWRNNEQANITYKWITPSLSENLAYSIIFHVISSSKSVWRVICWIALSFEDPRDMFYEVAAVHRQTFLWKMGLPLWKYFCLKNWGPNYCELFVQTQSSSEKDFRIGYLERKIKITYEIISQLSTNLKQQ